MKLVEVTKKVLRVSVVSGLLSIMMVTSVFAASAVLDNGGAKWSGGENDSGIVYSKIVDKINDTKSYNATVWVKNDKGSYKEKNGTTTGTGSAGKVNVKISATHNSPVIPEKCGYKNFYVVVK